MVGSTVERLVLCPLELLLLSLFVTAKGAAVADDSLLTGVSGGV